MKLKRSLVVFGGALLLSIPAISASAIGPGLLDPAGTTQCTDHQDNDNDGRIDYSGRFFVPADPDCTGPADNSEATETTPPTNGGTTPTNNTSTSDSTATNTNTNTSTNTNSNTSSSQSSSTGTSSSGSGSESCLLFCDSSLL